MNKERLLILAEAIEKNERPKAFPDFGFNMGTYGDDNTDDWHGERCGTVACIAGWAVALFAEKKPAQDRCDLWVYEEAKTLLDLGNVTAHLLFAPDDIQDMGDVTPKDAATVIRKLVETGYVDWSGSSCFVDPGDQY